MSNSKDIAEATKALSAPIVKLIEVISAGIGKLYRPIDIVRTAKATAKAHGILAEAFTQNPQIPTTYIGDKLTLDASDSDSLIMRMQSRVEYQELRRQVNIDSVIAEAYSQLSEEKQVSSDKVDEDWITRFFNYAGDISNEEMQILWGAVLAGEVKEPGSISIRTLDALRSLSRSEAELFKKISSFIFIVKSNLYLLSSKEFYNSQGIDLLDIVKLKDIGLLSSESLSLTCVAAQTANLFCVYNEYAVFMQSDSSKDINLSVCSLTAIGRDLYSIIPDKINNISNFNCLADYCAQRNVKLKYSKLINMNGTTVTYDRHLNDFEQPITLVVQPK